MYPIGTKVKVFTPSGTPFKFWGKICTVIGYTKMHEKWGGKSKGYLIDNEDLGTCRAYERSVMRVKGDMEND
mgnify:FL=1